MTTFGDQVFQYGGAAVSGPLSTGPAIYLKPGTGSDGASGKRPDRAVKTLSKAQTLMDADKNGVIFFVAEDNSASGTTMRISGSTFTFSKDGVKIQGINQNGLLGHRSRISNTADVADVSPLMSWSANNSSMANVHIFYGENDAGDLGCFEVTGERNSFYRCHFAGIGDNTQDAAGAYSLKITGDENFFEECTIGLDTVGRGTAKNSELLLAATATRNIFLNCLFLTFADSAGHQFIIGDQVGIDRFVWFKNCTFINSGAHSTGATMTEVLDIAATPGGTYCFDNCSYFGVSEIDVGDVTGILATGPAAAATTGIGIVPTT